MSCSCSSAWMRPAQTTPAQSISMRASTSELTPTWLGRHIARLTGPTRSGREREGRRETGFEKGIGIKVLESGKAFQWTRGRRGGGARVRSRPLMPVSPPLAWGRPSSPTLPAARRSARAKGEDGGSCGCALSRHHREEDGEEERAGE
eukprot:scaffold173032_cov33-Tisochrysis_lutea.AAC.3